MLQLFCCVLNLVTGSEDKIVAYNIVAYCSLQLVQQVVSGGFSQIGKSQTAMAKTDVDQLSESIYYTSNILLGWI